MRKRSFMAMTLAAVLAFGGIADGTVLVSHAEQEQVQTVSDGNGSVTGNDSGETVIEVQEDATVLPIRYDIGNRLLTLQVTNPSDKYRLAYSWQGSYSASKEKVLAEGTVLDEKVSEISANFDYDSISMDGETEYLSLWYVDENGNYVAAGKSGSSDFKTAAAKKCYNLMCFF